MSEVGVKMVNLQSSSMCSKRSANVGLKQIRMIALAIKHMGARFCSDNRFVVFLERFDACIRDSDLPVRVVEQGFNRPHGKGGVCFFVEEVRKRWCRMAR